MKRIKKQKQVLNGTKRKPTKEARSRAEARARAAQPAPTFEGKPIPIVDPTFVSAESVRSGAGVENIRKGKASNGQEFWREENESLEAFTKRVRDSVPVSVAADMVLWSEK